MIFYLHFYNKSAPQNFAFVSKMLVFSTNMYLYAKYGVCNTQKEISETL